MSLKFSTGNVFKPKYKLRVLRIRLIPLESTERYATFTVYLLILLPFCFRFSKYCSLWLHRPLCRYDLVLEESKEVTFRPIPCEESNFGDHIWPLPESFGDHSGLQQEHFRRINLAVMWSLTIKCQKPYYVHMSIREFMVFLKIFFFNHAVKDEHMLFKNKFLLREKTVNQNHVKQKTFRITKNVFLNWKQEQVLITFPSCLSFLTSDITRNYLFLYVQLFFISNKKKKSVLKQCIFWWVHHASLLQH